MMNNEKTKEEVKPHRLCIRTVHEPKIAVEGEKLITGFFVKNIGDRTFPGGSVSIRITWASLGENPFSMHTLKINKPIEPNSELPVDSIGIASIAAGYTLFWVVAANALDKNPVEVSEINGYSCFPYGKNKPPFALCQIRVQTHGEITQRRALLIAAGSLIAVVILNVISLAMRFLYNV
jgi:hypothetical protein